MSKVLVWGGVALAIAVRLAFATMGAQDRLGRRVEVVTPLNSLMRLAEGHWFKQLGLSPYAGSAYHGSPLLLALLGPSTTRGTGGQLTAGFLSSLLVFVAADLVGAMALYKIGNLVESAHLHQTTELQRSVAASKQSGEKLQSTSNTTTGSRGKPEAKSGQMKVGLGAMTALLYLINPFTVAVCVGGTTSSIENMVVILGLYGAINGNAPLAGFGWAMSTHLSMYPAILLIPMSLLVLAGPDRPQRKLLERLNQINFSNLSSGKNSETGLHGDQTTSKVGLQWVTFRDFVLFSVIWSLCILGLCSAALGGYEHLTEMLSETYLFILRVEDLSPNLGLFWYFFTEVFTHFRAFFVMVFHANILFVILPLTIRLHHRPLFLAYVLVAVTTMLKSYPSVGDAALSLSLLVLCTPVLSEFRFSFFILNGYLVVALLSPSMYNLWIWRGTGNANFYFAMALVYACVQSVLIVESVGTVVRHDRRLMKLLKEKVVT